MSQQTATRRAVLVASGSAVFTGCVSNTTAPSATDQDRMNKTDSQADHEQNNTSSAQNPTANMSDKESLSLLEATLNQPSDCPNVSVTFNTDTVTIVGCVTGANGCHIPAINQTEVSNDTLTVTIESRENRARDEVCTDAITQNGYELELLFSGPLPQKIILIHKDMHGRQTALTKTR